MYNIKALQLPEGITMKEYINLIYGSLKDIDEEEAKEKIFRLVFRIGYSEVKKCKIISIDDGLGCMGVAFMKTFNNYDPTNEDASFVNYFKLCIRTEIQNYVFRNYRYCSDAKDLCYKIEHNMDYLDEPITNKKDRETGTKMDLLIEENNIDTNLLDEDLQNRVLKVIDKVFAEATKYKPESKKIFQYYILAKISEEPISYKAAGQKYGRAMETARGVVLRYLPRFQELLKEEMELV